MKYQMTVSKPDGTTAMGKFNSINPMRTNVEITDDLELAQSIIAHLQESWPANTYTLVTIDEK